MRTHACKCLLLAKDPLRDPSQHFLSHWALLGHLKEMLHNEVACCGYTLLCPHAGDPRH